MNTSSHSDNTIHFPFLFHILLIRDLASHGLAVIMISSDLPEILGLSDRIAVMREGRLVDTMDGSGASAQTIMAAALRSA